MLCVVVTGGTRSVCEALVSPSFNICLYSVVWISGFIVVHTDFVVKDKLMTVALITWLCDHS